MANRVGLISATPFEAADVIKGLKRAGDFYLGRIGRRPVVYTASGIGIANAARAATHLIERFSPDIIILFGIGGAYPKSGLRVGDVAFAETEIYADAGVRLKDGLHDLRAIGIPLLKRGGKAYYNEFPLDRRLIKKAMAATGIKHTGVFLTVSASTGTALLGLALERRYKAICENMEGAAVAQIAALYGIPMLEVRGISNMVEDRDLRRWDKKTASLNCQKAVLELTASSIP